MIALVKPIFTMNVILQIFVLFHTIGRNLKLLKLAQKLLQKFLLDNYIYITSFVMQGGPCGVLATVQVYVLKDLLFYH